MQKLPDGHQIGLAIASAAPGAPQMFAGFSYLGAGKLRPNWTKPSPDSLGGQFAIYPTLEAAQEALRDVRVMDPTSAAVMVNVYIKETT